MNQPAAGDSAGWGLSSARPWSGRWALEPEPLPPPAKISAEVSATPWCSSSPRLMMPPLPRRPTLWVLHPQMCRSCQRRCPRLLPRRRARHRPPGLHQARPPVRPRVSPALVERFPVTHGTRARRSRRRCCRTSLARARSCPPTRGQRSLPSRRLLSTRPRISRKTTTEKLFNLF